MPVWIETENKSSLINADQIESITISSRHDYGPSEDLELQCLYAYSKEGCFLLIDDLTETQAQEALKHLSVWVPSTTPRTLRMSELSQSIKGGRQ